MTNLLSRAAAVAALLLGMVSHALAHDVWITIAEDAAGLRAVVNYGHPTERELPALDKLVDLLLVTPSEITSLREGKFEQRQISGAPVLLSQPFSRPVGAALLAARYDNGYWVKTPQGYRNASRRLVPTAEDSLWAVKFTKTLLAPDAYGRVVGHEIELVPLDDPFGRKSGDHLRVQVLFQGKPLADAEVELGDGISAVAEKDIPRYRTDIEGIALIPIERRGAFVLAVDHTVPGVNSALAAKDFFNATLAFVLE